MVLQGLVVPFWVGWLSGMLFYKVPWGIPKHITWFEPTFLYQSTLTLISLLIWFDYILSYNETFGGEELIRQIITKTFTYMAIIFSTYLRLCFLIQVKKSILFFTKLEQHGIFNNRIISNNNNNKNLLEQQQRVEHHEHHHHHQIIDTTDKIILMFALFLKIIAAGAFAAAIATQRKPQNSILPMLNTFEYTIIFFLFGSLPIAISIHIAFSFSVVITKYLIYIYEEFCNYFEQTILYNNDGGGNDNTNDKIEQQIIIQQQLPHPSLLSTNPFIFHNNKNDLIITNYKKQMRENILIQFDSVIELFQLYDEVTGPYLLGLVIITIIFFVQTINAILIFDLSPLFLAFDWFTLICLVAQLVLILFNLGHSAHRIMAYRKMKLRRLISGIPNNIEKEHLLEIIDLVSTWDWKMSAWGFFVIDRTLMPGVISIMMSYVVILFQLQLSTSTSHPLHT